MIIDVYGTSYNMQPKPRDKVVKKDNTGFNFTKGYKPVVAEYIGYFDQGEKVFAILRGLNESGTWEIGVVDPEELYIVV